MTRPSHPRTFAEALETLFDSLERLTLPARRALVVELGLEPGSVRREEFREPADYEARFQELLAAGFPWINVSCYGLYEGRLLVVVELPREATGAARTSVNYSGPMRVVLEHDWDVSHALTIV